MALVAVRTVVHVTVDALMVAVGVGLVRMLMAGETGEDQIILRVRVARIASRGPTMRLREISMVKHRSQPVRGAVAGLAGGREARRSVVRIRRAVVIGLVAAYARRVGKAVVAIDVALRAQRGGRVKSGQRPSCGRVIELAIGPENRVVAGLARRREAGCNMVHRNLGVVVIGLVASHAGRVGQVVVVVDVALRARRRGMEARQRPARGGVVELAIRPQNRVMTALARGWEAQRQVIYRRLSVVVVRLVAGHARRIRDFVIAVDVALQASHGCVEAGQRPSRRGVVKLSVGP